VEGFSGWESLEAVLLRKEPIVSLGLPLLLSNGFD
jgi:hypothetical protein